MIFEAMISVATFDILPTDLFFPGMFPNLDQEVPFSDKFEKLGYETQYIIKNMGTMFLVFCFNSILLILITSFAPLVYDRIEVSSNVDQFG